MLAPKLVAEIQHRLNAKTHSQRRIAVLFEISRGSVAAVATGKHRILFAEPKDDLMPDQAGPPTRCPRCGAWVYVPCLACRLRNQKPRTMPRRLPDTPTSLHLELRPEHRRRFEEVQAWRQFCRVGIAHQNPLCTDPNAAT